MAKMVSLQLKIKIEFDILFEGLCYNLSKIIILCSFS